MVRGAASSGGQNLALSMSLGPARADVCHELVEVTASTAGPPRYRLRSSVHPPFDSLTALVRRYSQPSAELKTPLVELPADWYRVFGANHAPQMDQALATNGDVSIQEASQFNNTQIHRSPCHACAFSLAASRQLVLFRAYAGSRVDRHVCSVLRHRGSGEAWRSGGARWSDIWRSPVPGSPRQISSRRDWPSACRPMRSPNPQRRHPQDRFLRYKGPDACQLSLISEELNIRTLVRWMPVQTGLGGSVNNNRVLVFNKLGCLCAHRDGHL